MVKANDHQISRRWEVIPTKEQEVEDILQIHEKVTLRHRNFLFQEREILMFEIIDYKKLFYKHIVEYFQIHRKYIKNYWEKEKYYPLENLRAKRKFYYRIDTTIDSLIKNEGSWWVIDRKKNKLFFVVNKSRSFEVNRSGKFKFVPDLVFYVQYDPVIARLIEFVGYDDLHYRKKPTKGNTKSK